MEIRERIMEQLQKTLVDMDSVHALWLEGADGLDRVDEYSDIDVWLDVDDGTEEAILATCLEILRQFGALDFVEVVDHPHPKIFQCNAHIAGTPEFLLLDICVQSHSRGSEGCTFVRGDVAEFPLVLFDKAAVVKIIDELQIPEAEMRSVYSQCLDTFEQQSRLRKYLLRRKFLEATAYYGKYVCDPLVTMARLLHTPRHYEYHLVHITDHLPTSLVKRLEMLHAVSSLADMESHLPVANALFAELQAKLREAYPFLVEAAEE